MQNLHFTNPLSTPQSIPCPESPKKRRRIEENKPNTPTKEKLNPRPEQVIGELLHKLEKEQKAVSTDKNNRIILKVKNRKIYTKVSAPFFLETFKMAMLEEKGNHTIIPLEKTNQEQLIFLNTFSKKNDRTEVKLFYVPSETKGEGSFSQYKEISKLGTDKIKGFKKVKNLRHNYQIDQEESGLKALHALLPVDKFLDSKGLKHLGIQDAYKFGQFGSKDSRSYAIGTAFDGDGDALICKGRRVLSVLYQLAFGLKILHDHGLFEHDMKAPNVLVSMDEKFPLSIRAVLSDLDLKTEQNYRERCENDDLSDQLPFGISTKDFQPLTDHKKMVSYHKAMRNRKTKHPQEFQKIFGKMMELRKKNMVSLLGQTFFQMLTYYPVTEEWPKEFISANPEEVKLFKNNLLNKIKSKQYESALQKNIQLNDEQNLFCVEITDLILDMTDLNHENRPTADEVLEKLLIMIKKQSSPHYKIIVENRWTNGYADWK